MQGTNVVPGLVTYDNRVWRVDVDEPEVTGLGGTFEAAVSAANAQLPAGCSVKPSMPVPEGAKAALAELTLARNELAQVQWLERLAWLRYVAAVYDSGLPAKARALIHDVGDSTLYAVESEAEKEGFLKRNRTRR